MRHSDHNNGCFCYRAPRVKSKAPIVIRILQWWYGLMDLNMTKIKRHLNYRCFILELYFDCRAWSHFGRTNLWNRSTISRYSRYGHENFSIYEMVLEVMLAIHYTRNIVHNFVQIKSSLFYWIGYNWPGSIYPGANEIF